MRKRLGVEFWAIFFIASCFMVTALLIALNHFNEYSSAFFILESVLVIYFLANFAMKGVFRKNINFKQLCHGQKFILLKTFEIVSEEEESKVEQYCLIGKIVKDTEGIVDYAVVRDMPLSKTDCGNHFIKTEDGEVKKI